MPLQPVTDDPGLWRDPAWVPHMPGVYALVVGVGAYHHLRGGGGTPAPDHFGLGQLDGSARTAARVFRWLQAGYHRDDLPVVWCRLLLSPTPAFATELAAQGLTHYGEPSYRRLTEAIDQWTAMLPQQPAQGVRASRTFFFFSGHGVQSNWHALLLPSDYLDPAQGLSPQIQNCISTRELRRWIGECPIGEHLALVDACRNEFSPLASMGAAAKAGFPAVPPGEAPRTAALLAATSPNHVAYQVPGRPTTVFGQAVIEAIEGAAAPGEPRLDFRSLVDYIRPRVNYILREAGATVTQDVRPQVDGDDRMVVTERLVPAPAAAVAPQPRGLPSAGATGARGLAASDKSDADADDAGDDAGDRDDHMPPVLAGPAGVARTRALSARTRDRVITVDQPVPIEVLRGSFAEAHRRMGHETSSVLWLGPDSVRLYGLADGQPLDGGAVVVAVARDEPGQMVHVDLSLDPAPAGVLLVFEAPGVVQRGRLGVALPTDASGRVPVRLALHLGAGQPGQPTQLLGLGARLGPDPGNPHYDYLWSLSQHARLNSLAEAAGEADVERLMEALDRHVDTQTAAICGALLLVRAGRFDRLGDWAAQLCAAFPAMPDGAVLQAAQLHWQLTRNAPSPARRRDLLDALYAALGRLIDRGAPFFADCLELAGDLARYALRQGPPPAQRATLEQLVVACERVFDLAMPGGDFTVLPGLPRPAWMDGEGALSPREMVRVLRGPRL